MVGLSSITVNPELVLTHELERDALLDVPEVAKGGCCLKWVVTLGTTIEAVPELSWPKVYECQFPNSSWKQCTAPSEVSSWSVAMWVPGFVDPRMLEMGLEVTEAVGETNVDAIRNLSALLAALRRLLLSASSSVISDSWGRFRLLWWGRLEAMASFALLSSSLRNRINSGSQFWLLLVVVKISKIRCFKSLGPLISEVAEVGGVGGRRLKPFLCHLPLKTKQILEVQIKTFKKCVFYLFCLECSTVSSGSVTGSISTASDESSLVGDWRSRLVCLGNVLGLLGIAPRLTLSFSWLFVTSFGLLGGSGSSLSENNQSKGPMAPNKLWFSLLHSGLVEPESTETVSLCEFFLDNWRLDEMDEEASGGTSGKKVQFKMLNFH